MTSPPQIHTGEYPVLFVDVVRSAASDRGPSFVVAAKNVAGDVTCYGPWSSAGTPDEVFWSDVLMQLKDRGIAEVWIVVAEHRRGLMEVLGRVWPSAVTLSEVTPALRASLRTWIHSEPTPIVR